MNEELFVRLREPDWQLLTAMCDRASVSTAVMGDVELEQFFVVYRRVSRDLSIARTKSTNPKLILFLNDLVARAHSIIVAAPRGSAGAALRKGVLIAVDTVRRCKWLVLASALSFLLAIPINYYLYSQFPQVRDSICPEPVVHQWTSGTPAASTSETSAAATSLYMTHNSFVSMVSGSIGCVSFGVLTLRMNWANGAMLGGLMCAMNDVGKLGFLLASIMPHGVPELSGLVMAGAGGFRLGFALIAPGRKRRSGALADAGADAIALLCVAAVLMLIAAPIEGFFSFNPKVPSPIKVVVIVVELIAWSAFWVGFRTREAESARS